jgi:hypothetical protein
MYTASAKSILNSVRLRKASGIAYCAFCALLRRRPRKASAPRRRALHRRFVIGADAGGFDFGRRIEAVDGREILHDLDAAAMAVHVAEAADVHENVEAELLAGGKRAQQFVVLPAMAQAKVDDFAAPRLAAASIAWRSCR